MNFVYIPSCCPVNNDTYYVMGAFSTKIKAIERIMKDAKERAKKDFTAVEIKYIKDTNKFRFNQFYWTIEKVEIDK